MKTIDLIQPVHFATGETGVQDSRFSREMETEQGSPERPMPSSAPMCPSTPLFARGGVDKCSICGKGEGLSLLAAPAQARVLSGPSEISKINYGVSKGRELGMGC